MVDASSSVGDEQTKWLKEASMSIKRNSFFMKRALDEDNLREALRYSAAMLGELRTSLLGPQKYYELYMQAFDELRHLELFFMEERKKGRFYSDLYELVQHAGNVLPRLYLMCSVGSCFIRSKEGFAKDVLKDLVEMCKGVQHPTRGLFLRSYLCQACRGLLPDAGSPYEGEGGTINDALEFLLVNFIEMNKLWVRMQHQGTAKDREKREKERQQLADLVGKNITYISQLEGLDFALYSQLVLPRVVQQIVNCKDDIAQQYLMQCLIQGFPDDFHLGTLDTLLNTCSALQSGVKVFLIMSSLMDRLTRYARDQQDAKGQFDKVVAFDKLKEACARISEAHADMPLAEVIAMYVSLMDFTANVYNDNLQAMDDVLDACTRVVSQRTPLRDPAAEKRLLQLLTIPLDQYNVVTVLSLTHYPEAMALLEPDQRKAMASKIVETIIRNNTLVGSLEKVDKLFGFVAPLVTDQEPLDEEDLQEQQAQVARLVHQLRSDDVAEQQRILKLARAKLLSGDSSRYILTLPSVVVSLLQLVQRVVQLLDEGQDPRVRCDGLLLLVHTTIARLVDLAPADHVLQLYLLAAHCASEVTRLELMAYEFFEQAFVIYEENVPDTKQQVTALQTIVGSLLVCHVFSRENRDVLVSKAVAYCAKLLKKTEQCRAMCLCSHLSWQNGPPGWAPPEGGEEGAAAAGAEDREAGGEHGSKGGPSGSSRDADGSDGALAEQVPWHGSGRLHTEEEEEYERKPEERSSKWPIVVREAGDVMVCLKRALKIANAAEQQLAIKGIWSSEPVILFVEILNLYLYYFDQDLPTISVSTIQTLLELAANEMMSEHCQKDEELVALYNNTLRHIQHKQKQPGKLADKYKDVQT